MIRQIKKTSVVIFTDLDGTLLDRDTFKFDEIKDYIKSLINKGITIIPKPRPKHYHSLYSNSIRHIIYIHIY